MLILIGSLLVVLFGFSVFFGGSAVRRAFFKLRKRKIKKRDLQIRDYLQGFKEDDKLSIIDETPREVFVGDRFYLLKPLKYRQYTRLCILFSKMLQKLSENGMQFDDMSSAIGDSMEVLEDEYFKAIALILYFSNHSAEETEVKQYEGTHKEYEYLRKHATLDQITRVLEVIQIQNDIDRALKAFGLLGGKKKIAQSKK